MKKIMFLLILSTTFLIGCNSIPKDDIEIESEADPKVKFSGY